jgi:hypothetical protein
MVPQSSVGGAAYACVCVRVHVWHSCLRQASCSESPPCTCAFLVESNSTEAHGALNQAVAARYD